VIAKEEGHESEEMVLVCNVRKAQSGMVVVDQHILLCWCNLVVGFRDAILMRPWFIVTLAMPIVYLITWSDQG